MKTTTQTAYGILGVEQSATEKEIQKAFRRLAKSVHPDINKADDAHEKFQDIQEAYDLLSDPESRKRYDEHLKHGDTSFDPELYNKMFSAFKHQNAATQRPLNGEDIEVTLQVTATQILTSHKAELTLDRHEVCDKCEGGRFQTKTHNCKECNGVGSFPKEMRTPFGKIESSITCKACSGTGKQQAVECDGCHAEGRTKKKVSKEVVIPSKLRFGDIISYLGEGHKGINGGKNGNLKVTLEQSPYDKMSVKYDVDLHERKEVSLVDALSLESYKIQAPDGSELEVNLKSSLSNGVVQSFPEQGFYKNDTNRGTYNVEFVLAMPDIDEIKRKRIVDLLEG